MYVGTGGRPPGHLATVPSFYVRPLLGRLSMHLKLRAWMNLCDVTRSIWRTDWHQPTRGRAYAFQYSHGHYRDKADKVLSQYTEVFSVCRRYEFLTCTIPGFYSSFSRSSYCGDSWVPKDQASSARTPVYYGISLTPFWRPTRRGLSPIHISCNRGTVTASGHSIGD